MKLLLTSGGIKNDSIHAALVEMLGKPISESDALCIPTASYGHPSVPPTNAWAFITGAESGAPMTGLGWKSVGLLELTALPSIGKERWVPWIEQSDVLLADGGDALYLCYWMRQSGFADLMPSLVDTVYASVSAGSMVMTPRIGEDFVHWKPPAGSDETLGVVEFSIFHTWTIRICRKTRCRTPNNGRLALAILPTRSTMRPRSRLSTARPRSCPRANGIRCNRRRTRETPSRLLRA